MYLNPRFGKLFLTACCLFSTPASAQNASVSTTILIIASTSTTAASGSAGLDAYSIPYEVLLVPQDGVTLPALEANDTGIYGGIVVMSEVSYQYSTGWASALTNTQWSNLYAYQSAYGVRMVRLDVYPDADFGCETVIDGAGCCDTGVEQLISFTDTSAFPGAKVSVGVTESTIGLWHYPALITDSSVATQIAQFAPSGNFTNSSTAAIINNFSGREQMVFFITWETSWSATDNYLQKSWIHWITNNTITTSPSSSTSSSVPSSTSAISSSASASSASRSSSASSTATSSPSGSISVSSTILVLTKDATTGYSGTSGLNAYGIPFELVIVPQTGVTLPSLSSSSTQGNYGGIIVLSEVSYDYSTGWASALTTAQWQSLYDYQTAFGVRMTRLDVYPGSDFGTTTTIDGEGCCDAPADQLITFTDDSTFPTANLQVGAGLSTAGLWHYPATITDSSTTVEIAQFGAGGDFSGSSTAAVINTFSGGREQMVFFISWSTDWSTTSVFLQHAYIHWMTRGLFVGYRRIYFNGQVDDCHLETNIYQPNGTLFRFRPSDLEAHVTWQVDINSRLPAGSSFLMELGHNGNGNIIEAVADDTTGLCVPETSINLIAAQLVTPAEFQKPLGTGTSLWPSSPLTYGWSLACTQLDALNVWFQVPANRDKYAHISHTFTHESLNNATYFDTNLQIVFNQVWLQQVGIAAGSFSSHGLIPPAITGLHNGDAIQAWMHNGINVVVGDNTRPLLLNSENEHWPLITNVADNGYAGLTIMPRWSTPIYYDCYSADCTTAEWIATAGGAGDFDDLLTFSRSSYTHHLLQMRHDPFMFHQANLRQGDMPTFTVGSVTGSLSLYQIFVETILQEMMRLTTWPIITKTHDDLGTLFLNRMALDACSPTLTYTTSADQSHITAVTIGATGNTCSVPIPVQFPGTATTTAGGVTDEQVGSDPLTKWVTLSGSAVTFTLDTPIAV